MDTIEKTAPNLRYLQPPLLLRNESGRFVRVDAGDVVPAGRGPAAAPRSATSTTTATSTSSLSNVGQKAVVLRNDGGNRRTGCRIRDRRHEIEPRRHRVPRQGGVRVRPDSVLHGQHRRRLSLGERQAADWSGSARTRAATLVEIRWPSGVVQTIRERQSRADARRRPSRRDDAPGELIACAGAARRCGASGVRPGHLVARRQAAAARQAVRPSVPRALHRCRAAGRPDRSRSIYGGVDTQELHHRSGRAAAWRSSTTTTTAGSTSSC